VQAAPVLPLRRPDSSVGLQCLQVCTAIWPPHGMYTVPVHCPPVESRASHTWR
jgi:hypothetical protein